MKDSQYVKGIGGEILKPSPTAARGEQVGITSYRRCVRCGMLNNTRTDMKCAACGSVKWTGSMITVPLPDDQFLPDPKLNRRRYS